MAYTSDAELAARLRNLDAYLKAPTPAPATPQLKRPGILKRAFFGAVNALDTAQRGIKKGTLHALPDRLVSPQFANLVGQKDFSGALEETGRIQKATDLKGRFRNMAIDAILDPTNFLTFGGSGGAKIAAQGGKEVLLTKKGTQLLKSATKEVTEAAGKTVKNIKPADYAKFARQAELKVAQQIADTGGRGLVDKGGVKFAGKTIVPGEFSTQPVGKAFRAVADKIGANKILGPGSRDFLIRDNLSAKRITQTFHDVQNARSAQFAERLAPTLKGLNKGDREAATFLRVSGVEGAGKYKPVLDLAEKELGQLGKELEKRGLVKGLLDEYLPLIIKDPGQKLGFERFMNSIAPSFRFGKTRSIKDTFRAITLAKQRGFDVETDIGNLLSSYVKTANKAIAQQDMLKSINKELGVSAKVFAGGTEPTKNAQFRFPQTPEVVQQGKAQQVFTPRNQPLLPGGRLPAPELVPTTRITFGKGPANATAKRTVTNSEDFVTPTLKQIDNPQTVSLTGEMLVPVAGTKELADVLIPESLARHLTQMNEQFVKDAATNKFLRNYDKVTNMYRGFLTSAFPAFHVRNELSNTVQNMLDVGVLRAIDPRLHADALIFMSGKAADSGRVVKFGGREFTVGNLRKIMQDSGILQGSDPFEVVGDIKKLNVGRRVGRAIENRSRVVNFLANLNKTGSIQTAAEATKRTLFDYGNLSPFERNVVRRIFLFPTWNSRNFILQAENLFKKPGFFTKYGIASRELTEQRGEQDQALLPDYLRQDLTIPLGKDDKGNIKTLQLFETPFSSAFKFASPGNLLSGLAPAVKIPAELVTGTDFFRTSREGEFKKISEVNYGRDLAVLKWLPEGIKKAIGFTENAKIDPTTGAPTGEFDYQASPIAAYITRNNPLSRFGATASYYSDNTSSGGQDALRTLTGANITATNVESQIKGNTSLYKKQLAQPLIDQGILREYQGSYFVPKNIQFTDEQKALGEGVAKTLNSRDSVTGMYLASLGVQPDAFPQLFSASTDKKLSNRQMAALLAASQGLTEEAARILAPSAFKTSGGRGRASRTFRVSVPSTKLSKPRSAGKLPKSRVGKLKVAKPKGVRFTSGR